MLDVMISQSTGPLERPGCTPPRIGDAPPPGNATTSSTFKAKQVSVSGEEFYCSSDGEIYGPERQRSWRIEPAAYSLVLPPR